MCLKSCVRINTFATSLLYGPFLFASASLDGGGLGCRSTPVELGSTCVRI